MKVLRVKFDPADGEEQPSVATGLARLDVQDTETAAQENEYDDVQDQDQDQAQIPVQEDIQNNVETVTRTSVPITLLLGGTGSEYVDDSAHPSTSHPTQADTPVEVQSNTSHPIQANIPVDAQPHTSHPLQPNPPANTRPNPPHNQPIRPSSHPIPPPF